MKDQWQWIGAYSYRLKVPGGWLVRSAIEQVTMGGGTAMVQTFVADVEHQWELKDE